MSQRNFMQLLQAKWDEGKFVCVGLDSHSDQLPESMSWLAVLEFNQAIVDATSDKVCAYKPNLAFYMRDGVLGLTALHQTISYINDRDASIPVILDAKVGDIGNTNLGYTEMAFDWLKADAITVHNYLGQEAMKPFLDRADKGVIVLCRTSNKGAGEFQDQRLMYDDGCGTGGYQLLFHYVAQRVADKWNYNRNCAVVVGATYPKELAQVRQIVGDMPILIPGIGAQGGDLEATVEAGQDSRGQGMIINSSRGIIFASSGPDFAVAARRETLKLHEQITTALAVQS